MSITIPEAVRALLSIVDQLAKAYPKKSFTLDGRLVGDIGEVLVANAYEIDLFDDLQKHHDGRSSCGRYVQIKATMKAKLSLPADHVPEHYLGIQIHPDGTFTEVFNGPGDLIHRDLSKRSRPKNSQHSINVSRLQKLQEEVVEKEKIARRHHVRVDDLVSMTRRTLPRLSTEL